MTELNWTMNCCFEQQFCRPKSWASGMFEHWCWLSRSKSGQKNCVQPQITGHFFRLCSLQWGSSKLQARCKTQDNKNICEKGPSTSEEEAQGWKTGVGSFMVALVLSFSRRRTWKQEVTSITEVISGKLGRIWRLFKKIASTAKPWCHWGLLSAILDHKSNHKSKMSKAHGREVVCHKKIINPWTKKQSGSDFYDTIRALDAKQ